jgi:mRNA-degrading endonuclease RelE of RelBE toxin-antitoxin system
MENYTIYSTENFNRTYLQLDKTEQQWIDKIKKKLEENPTGKILKFEWFREKKYLNKRLYFLVNDKNKKILFLAFATKKEQQKTIDFTIANMRELLDYLRRL